MSQRIAEYLGVELKPGGLLPLVDSSSQPQVLCPFRDGSCVKAQKGQVPVCSLRDSDSDELWIICEHRLCATTPKSSRLVPYQVEILCLVLDAVVPGWPDKARPAAQREARVRRTSGVQSSSDSKADFLIVFRDLMDDKESSTLENLIIEMQGGGETSNTKRMTEVVRNWEKLGDSTADSLRELQIPVAPIETNAWRRQQEQFLFKGSVVTRSGGRLVFAMGARLYDKVMNNLKAKPSEIPIAGGWTLALLGFIEDSEGVQCGDSLALSIDPERQLFTAFDSFVRSLTEQGEYDPNLFVGEFQTFDGAILDIK
jgi:hypothetical protein